MREELHAARAVVSSCRITVRACATTIAAGLAIGSLPSLRRAAAPPPVDVFPIPGGRVASPATQITFRGVAPSQIGQITVQGSASGVHSGTIQADSDGRGGSFVPELAVQARRNGHRQYLAEHRQRIGGPVLVRDRHPSRRIAVDPLARGQAGERRRLLLSLPPGSPAAGGHDHQSLPRDRAR